ncbi:MAG: hypothetical protein JW725_05115, partial [Candidatus Babeliaceae bacterium]|nr:hypothetical protein [Candidatus Babeliaceae bacterium]
AWKYRRLEMNYQRIGSLDTLSTTFDNNSRVLFITLILCGVAFAAVNFFTASIGAKEPDVEWGELRRVMGEWVCFTGVPALNCCIVHG